MEYHILAGPVCYTGVELRSGWAARQTGLSGDAAVGFFGACDVPTENLVDKEDAAAGASIRAKRMAHVIVEHPSCPLATAVLRQRLLVCILSEALTAQGLTVQRDGDDIYLDGRKLTVSIAAPTSTGSILHLGINVDPEGAPVPAIGLKELGVNPEWLLTTIIRRYRDELTSCAHAEAKVRSVP